jgi:alanine racemase
MGSIARSLFTLDLGAVRHNARCLVDVLDGAELWAVVKADGYGHGAADVARAALEAGASALCVATVGEGLALRPAFPGVRMLVLGPARAADVSAARAASLELVVSQGSIPEDVLVHVKLDTGMGRWGASELPSSTRQVVGLMTHFAVADTDPDFTALQLERFVEAAAACPELPRHAANSAAALSFPASRLEAARCGIALYGISPFGGDPADDGLRPALRWESEVAEVRSLAEHESTGYGRRYVADRPTRIGLVPVGYADGFRRDMTGTEVVVSGQPSRVVGTVSMDALAVELPAGAAAGDVVTLVGDGATIEQHAAVAGTIGYELACGLVTRPPRAWREVVDG